MSGYQFFFLGWRGRSVSQKPPMFHPLHRYYFQYQISSSEKLSFEAFGKRSPRQSHVVERSSLESVRSSSRNEFFRHPQETRVSLRNVGAVRSLSTSSPAASTNCKVQRSAAGYIETGFSASRVERVDRSGRVPTSLMSPADRTLVRFPPASYLQIGNTCMVRQSL